MYKYWTCEKMKMFRGFFGGRSTIKVTSKLLKIQNSKTCGCNLTFDPWKLSSQERQKGKIKRSNTLFANQKAWSRSQTLQQATYKWPPLGVADWISGNDRRLVQPSQMWVTDYSTWVSEWAMQNPGVTREMRVSWKVCIICVITDCLSMRQITMQCSQFILHVSMYVCIRESVDSM